MRSKEVRLQLGVEIEKAVLSYGASREDIALVLEKRKDAVERCAELIIAALLELKNRLEFSVTVSEGETFHGFIQAGKYDWKWHGITSQRFPIRKFEPGERKLVILHFGREINSEQALEEAARQGLERPTYEDCFRFGAQHPEVQRKFPIVFLHEPVQVDNGDPSVLCLDHSRLERDLVCSWFFGTGKWGYVCRFAFVLP